MGNQNDQSDERQPPEKQVKNVQILLRLDEQMVRKLDEVILKLDMGNNRAEVVREIVRRWITEDYGLLKAANTKLAAQKALMELTSSD